MRAVWWLPAVVVVVDSVCLIPPVVPQSCVVAVLVFANRPKGNSPHVVGRYSFRDYIWAFEKGFESLHETVELALNP